MTHLKAFIKSMRYAFRGLRLLFSREQNFRIEVFVGLAVIALTIALPLDIWEKILLILMVSAVLVLEILNTIFERISDILKPRLHPVVKEIKDMMAAAVLITSITAAVIGLIIFWTFIKENGLFIF